MSGSTYYRLAALAALAFYFAASAGRPAPTPVDAKAQGELDALAAKVPGFRVLPLAPGAGETALKAADSLTIEALRGVKLDDAPPVLAGPVPQYDPRQADDCAGPLPYVARGIEPFRFREFHCEFNYGGWHNFTMQDYAATHGFDVLFPYVRKKSEVAHWPKGTQILSWGGFIDWHKWLPAHNIPDGRYDQLAGLDLVKMHVDAGLFRREPAPTEDRPRADLLMIDMEHPVLSPEKLREQEWYPKAGAPAERAAFEKRYYDGYAQTYVSSVLAARRQGWETISIYGWYPYGRTWGGLEQAQADPGSNQAWNSFGRQVCDAVDLVNNSVYCFYWSPQNVAYTLANIDMNVKIVRSAAHPKPLRPYFWTLLHGGGAGWRWWRDQPIANEEERAMIAMAFFTGIEGLDSWNWSGTGSHQTVSLRHAVKTKTEDGGEKTGWEYDDVMVGREFACKAENGTEETFRRYDVLHVLSLDEATGAVRFQKIRPKAKNAGATDDQPFFSMPQAELLPLLRPKSEPVGAMVEGLALVKPFEYLLRHGEVKIDVPAQEQFAGTLPIVRRVKLGGLHLIATYDPAVVYGGKPREIVLKDFDGVAGRTLRLPADEQTRLFVLRDPDGAGR